MMNKEEEIQELKDNLSALNVILENTTNSSLLGKIHNLMAQYNKRLKKLENKE